MDGDTALPIQFDVGAKIGRVERYVVSGGGIGVKLVEKTFRLNAIRQSGRVMLCGGQGWSETICAPASCGKSGERRGKLKSSFIIETPRVSAAGQLG